MICINKKCARALPEGARFCPVCGRKQIREQHRRSHGNGQGSVYKLPSGKWRAEKVVGWKTEEPAQGSPPGTPKKRMKVVATKTCSTKTEALAALPTLTMESRTPRSGPLTVRKKTRITLLELRDLWEPTHDMGQSTRNCYRGGFKLFKPLWDVPLEKIGIDDLQACLDDSPLGRKVKENARTCIGLVYKYGIPRDCVPEDRNLGHFLKIRVDEEKENTRCGLSREELQAVERLAAAGDLWARYVVCHCYLGFRPTALLQLRAEDYNAQERAFVGGIKTEAGIDRTVTVSPKIQPYVDTLLSAHGGGYVFGDAQGRRLPIKRYREEFYKVLERAGVNNPIDAQGVHRLTPHSCRHTFATLMKRAQGSDTDKLALIGHTSTSQLREYQDVDFADLRRITDQL